MNQEVTFMSDGACNLRDLQRYMRPNAEHVLDYFHISMRITVLQEMARGLPAQLCAALPAAIAVLESVRRHIWHGNVDRALAFVEDFVDGFDLIRDPRPEVRKLRRYLEEFSRYVDNNTDLIPNYAERHRYGEVVSTAFVESTVNQVVAKRFARSNRCSGRRVAFIFSSSYGPVCSTALSIQTSNVGASRGTYRKMRSNSPLDDPQLFYAPSLLREFGMEPCTMPARRPQSNGMAEAFVKTFKRDYVSINPTPDAETVMAQLPFWFEHCNHLHPHKVLRHQAPSEFGSSQSQT